MKNKIIEDLKEAPLTPSRRKKLSKIFSDKFGIVNAILRRYELESFGWSMFQSLSAKTSVLFGLSRDVSSGGLGVDTNPTTALIKCFGEAVERYCMSFTNDKKIMKKGWKSLPANNRIENFCLYSNKQYTKYKNTFKNPKISETYWTKIKNFIDKDKFIYFPASLIFLPFEKEKIAAEPSSTGVAANFQINEAIFSGILEIIERDAIMINHYRRFALDEVDQSSIKGANLKLINKLKKDRFNIKIFKLKSDIKIPIFQAFIWRGHGKNLHYGIGASANLRSEQAVNKSLQECLFAYFYSKNLLHLKEKRISKITKLYEHFLYYQGNEFNKLPIFDHKKIDFKKESHTRKYLLNELKRNGLVPYYIDLTTSDIKATGFKVVRVVIPGMIDLNKTHKIQRESADRFWMVPKKLNIKCKNTKLNKLPHPFP